MQLFLLLLAKQILSLIVYNFMSLNIYMLLMLCVHWLY